MSEEKMNEELSLANVKLITSTLGNFIKTHFNACESFHSSLNDCTTQAEIIRLFKKHSKEVYTNLGGDSEYDQDDIDAKDHEIDELGNEINELTETIDELTGSLGGTLNGEMKLKTFHEYHNNYDPWEFEELLINGKKYTNK